MKQTKLSKQQKAILNLLNKQEYKTIEITSLSRKIAHKFNKGHKDRIFDRKQAKIEHPEYSALISSRSKKQQILTQKHRASFSRSVDRLKKRGLIKKSYNPVRRMSDAEFKRKVKDPTWSTSFDIRATHVSLTKNGLEYFEN